MTAEYATYRYLRCVVNVMLLLGQLSVSFAELFLTITADFLNGRDLTTFLSFCVTCPSPGGSGLRVPGI